MKSFEIETEHNEITVYEHDGVNFSLFIAGYDGWTYLTLDEMKRLVEGIQGLITSAETGESHVG